MSKTVNVFILIQKRTVHFFMKIRDHSSIALTIGILIKPPVLSKGNVKLADAGGILENA